MDEFSRIKSIRRKNLRKAIVKIGIVVVAAFVAIALMLIPFFNKQVNTARIYNEVITLIENENYSEAYEKLESIVGSDYKDTTSLLYLCSSHMLYDQGNVVDAYEEIEKVDFVNQTEEQETKIDEYREMLKTEYDKYEESNISTEEPLDETTEDSSQKSEQDTKDNGRTSDVKSAEEEFAYDDAESFEADDTSIGKGKKETENKNEND